MSQGQPIAQAPGHHAQSLTVPFWSPVIPVLALILLVVITGQRPDGRLHVWILDVGEGSAVLLSTPGGHVALIDGGPAATPLLNAVGKRMPSWQRNIDMLVLTSPRDDALMGLASVPERYGVGQVVRTEFTATGSLQSTWLRTEKSLHLPVHIAKAGEQLAFNGEPDVNLRVLSAPVKKVTTPDASHLVLKLTYGRSTLLLEGGAQHDTEDEMLKTEKQALLSTVLQVGSFGSDKASTMPFLLAVDPRMAVISVGAGNKQGYPSQSTLDSLDELGAQVYRTDVQGSIEIISDGQQMWVRSEK